MGWYVSPFNLGALVNFLDSVPDELFVLSLAEDPV